MKDRERGKRRWWKTAAMAASSAAAAFFFDPRNGKRRRKMLHERPVALLRRGERRAERAIRYGRSQARGVSARVRHTLMPHPAREYDDATLVHKVESEVFRFRKIPKRALNIDAADGVVSLRGQVDDARTISEIIKKTKRVEGVRDVENLLHLPGTEAPHHESMRRSGNSRS